MPEIWTILQCPHCAAELNLLIGHAHCAACTRDYPLRGGFLDLRLSHTERSARFRSQRAAAPLDYLEAGCGLHPPAGCVGVDISPAYLDRARLQTPDASLLLADLRNLPFRDGSFRSIRCWEVLEHIAEREAAIAELARVLAPGGRLTFSAANMRFERMLGRISHNYRRSVVEGFHSTGLAFELYPRLAGRYLRLERMMPEWGWNSAAKFLIALRLDRNGVTFNDAGELVGDRAEKVLSFCRRWNGLTALLFKVLIKLSPGRYSTSVICEAVKA